MRSRKAIGGLPYNSCYNPSSKPEVGGRMLSTMRALALVLIAALSLAVTAAAQELDAPPELPLSATGVPEPQNVRLIDRPGDAGTGLYVLFELEPKPQDILYVLPQVEVDGRWALASDKPLPLQEIPCCDDLKGIFGAEALQTLAPGTPYHVQLTLANARGTRSVDAGTLAPRENLFAPQRLNILLISFLFAAIILVTIFRARQNPGALFVRRIAGLEAVEEAIGRATEMGKPVMQINGLDPLTTPSTIAAVNILGQIARKVAHYDSRLMVPSYDPVVMTVSQETVKQAYLSEGRPDAYREDDIFFVTDQQFSYVASVCGLMLRERPAANFFLGYFYAESLLLAETGQSTGAIQIAGTDSQSQLPFFITTCDYTLIGEELYAASAYLSREPMLLAGLKGLDFSKVIIMLLIFFGSLLATFGVTFLTELFTPLG
jgi:hypothetical protein